MSFDSILVRLKVKALPGQVQQGRFDSILVRLKGFMKAIDILYRVLMTRVKLIFTYSVSEIDLLSTCSRANSLGG